MATKKRKETVWDRAKQYVEANKGFKYDLEEAWVDFLAEWEYVVASAWDAGYQAGMRHVAAKKRKGRK